MRERERFNKVEGRGIRGELIQNDDDDDDNDDGACNKHCVTKPKNKMLELVSQLLLNIRSHWSLMFSSINSCFHMSV